LIYQKLLKIKAFLKFEILIWFWKKVDLERKFEPENNVRALNSWVIENKSDGLNSEVPFWKTDSEKKWELPKWRNYSKLE
jgi:hypothetical protein